MIPNTNDSNCAQSTTTEADTSGFSWTTANLEDHFTFTKLFSKGLVLGRGGDGIVTSYRNRYSGDLIAVKIQKDDSAASEEQIMDEVENLKALGKHEYIAEMLAVCRDFGAHGPAIFFQLCDLGDLHGYYRRWCAQEIRNDRPARVPEVTVLKLFRDLSFGLDFLHNAHNTCYVHNDLKPENVLVLTPPDYSGGDIPAEPIFKITDFARLTPFPTPPRQRHVGWRGTFVYAPPHTERSGPIKPSADIYSLGATIQAFALNVTPTQSRAAFVECRMRQERGCPDPGDKAAWKFDNWKRRIPVVYWPLGVSEEELHTKWDVNKRLPDHKPYSTQLNLWYRQLFEEDPEVRVTSAHLKKYFVPMFEKQMKIARKLALAEECFERAKRIRANLGASVCGTSRHCSQSGK